MAHVVMHSFTIIRYELIDDTCSNAHLFNH